MTGVDRRRRHQRLRRWVASVCVVVIAAVIAGVPVYVLPQTDPLRRADAILIIGGTGWDRYPFGIELGVQGWAPTVVLSNPDGARDPWLVKTCANPPAGIKLICFGPDPVTTLGEGRKLRELATANGWRTIIVVTFRPHISRARFILEHCFDGDLVMVASPANISLTGWMFEYAYQTVGYVRAAARLSC